MPHDWPSPEHHRQARHRDIEPRMPIHPLLRERSPKSSPVRPNRFLLPLPSEREPETWTGRLLDSRKLDRRAFMALYPAILFFIGFALGGFVWGMGR